MTQNKKDQEVDKISGWAIHWMRNSVNAVPFVHAIHTGEDLLATVA